PGFHGSLPFFPLRGRAPSASRPPTFSVVLYFARERLSASLPPWPRKSRVGANSPSLWPTMFSVMYTGMNLFPLCTASVCPTKSGEMVDARAHVLITRFSPVSFIFRIFSRSLASMYGPFLIERAISVAPPYVVALPRRRPRTMYLFELFL